MASELVFKVPADLGKEFNKIPEENWQLLFSRFLREKLERIKRIEEIVSKSKLTEEQAKKLGDDVSFSLAKRFLKASGESLNDLPPRRFSRIGKKIKGV